MLGEHANPNERKYMGLDMYLSGDKYIWTGANSERIEDGFRVKSHVLELGYWRKHPDLHGYIVDHFADGVDDCRPISLSQENIQQIIEAISNDDLPHTEGFFFGASENDPEQRQSSIDILSKACAWLQAQPETEWRTIIYQASW